MNALFYLPLDYIHSYSLSRYLFTKIKIFHYLSKVFEITFNYIDTDGGRPSIPPLLFLGLRPSGWPLVGHPRLGWLWQWVVFNRKLLQLGEQLSEVLPVRLLRPEWSPKCRPDINHVVYSSNFQDIFLIIFWHQRWPYSSSLQSGTINIIQAPM